MGALKPSSLNTKGFGKGYSVTFVLERYGVSVEYKSALVFYELDSRFGRQCFQTGKCLVSE